MLRTFLVSWRDTGYLFGHHIISILRKDLFVLGLTDLVMFLSTFVCLLLQKAVYRGVISWNRSGWILQHVHSGLTHADLVLARDLPCRLGWMDFLPGMGMASDRFHRPSLSCFCHETTFLRILHRLAIKSISKARTTPTGTRKNGSLRFRRIRTTCP
jgi:hypothetical protein